MLDLPKVKATLEDVNSVAVGLTIEESVSVNFVMTLVVVSYVVTSDCLNFLI